MIKLVENLEPIICDCCGKITYSAKDVCDLLGIDNAERALKKLDPDMKSEMVSDSDEEDWDLSEPDKMDVVNLNGIFALVFQSKTSFAKITQRRIIDEYVEKIISSSGETKKLKLLPAGAER